MHNEVESAIAYLFSNYKANPTKMGMSLEAAQSIGIDISGAPAGSICWISEENGVEFEVIE